MNRYEITVDFDDIDTLDVIRELFTNVVITDVPESSIVTSVTFDATDDALDAYLARFDFDADERDDIFTPVD